MIARWWHRHKGHDQYSSRVSVPMFDTSRGVLIRCSCGESWAL